MSVFSSSFANLANLPLKLQAQKIKNNSQQDIYIFDIDDDVSLTKGLVAFCQAVVQPGCEIDLSNHPFVHLHAFYFPDFDVCIHSLGDVHVDTTSDNLPIAWVGKPNHPWNGAPMANGQLTNRWNASATLPTLSTPPPPPPPTLPQNAFWGTITGSSPTFKPLSLGTDYTEAHYREEVLIPKECICATRVLMNNGCICGHIKRKQWGLR